MSGDIRKSERGGKTAYLNIGVWFDEDQGRIHMALPGPGGFVTTVNDNPDSLRGHPNLFMKLARALKEAGVPGPEVRGKEDA